MKSMRHTPLMLALAWALSLPVMAMAADAASNDHASHHPDQAQTGAPGATTPQERAKGMRERMMSIRAEKDPAKRKELLEAQMKDMEAMLDSGGCPMMAGGKGGGMMGGKMGPGMGMMGQGMQGGMSGMDDMMARRMEMMEQRIDMMQMMMRQRSGPDMQGGMGMSCPEDRMTRRMEMMEQRLDMMQRGMGPMGPGMQGGGMGMPAR